MALSALLLLLPLLLNVQKIPDEAVQSDMNAVDLAISSMNQWQGPRNSLATLEPQLTVAQRALLKMHWEQETVQREKPEAPPQFDLGLFSEALEAMVEMDETAKEVKLRTDKLNEWAGEKLLEEEEEEKTATAQKEGQNERTEVRENDEERSFGTVPEVRVKEDGNVEVKSVGGGEGKMEVRRGRDKNGNEEVVVTFVKKDGKQRAQEEGAEAEKKPQEKEQKMKTYSANNANTSVPTPPTSSSSAASVEEEGDKSRWNANNLLVETNGSAIPRRIDEFLTRNGGLNGTVADKVRGRERETEERFENVGISKNGRDFADGWFYSPPLTNGGGPFGSLLNLFFGRKKRETMMRENVQKMEDGRTLRTMEKLITSGKPGSIGFMTKVVDVVMSVDGAGGRQADISNNNNNNSSTVKKDNWMVKQGGTEGESNGRKTDTTKSASGGLLKAAMDENGERNATRQSRTGDGVEQQQQQQDERKVEIKQYLKRCVASTDGQKKWEKLAYVWYSQKLYWTAKWVEVSKLTPPPPPHYLSLVRS
uniref:Chromo domain-containing protein n=1 Tax=Globodera pallida TaxID=36090 RepID=A0A183CAR7_GLOPA